MPEIDGCDLSASVVRSALEQSGCLIVRSLTTRERVAGFPADIDRVIERALSRPRARRSVEDRAWFEPFSSRSAYGRSPLARGRRRRAKASKGAVLMADSPRMFFDVYQLLAETGVTDVLHAYFGERPAFGYQKGVLRRTEGKNNWGWHQDGAILGQEIASLNVWLALSDCGESSPSLDIVPRRIDHLVETGTDGANRSWSIAPDQIPEAAGATPVVRPVFAPGDALLFDHLLLHRAGGDVTMRLPRYAIESWFFAPSNYPATQLPLLV